MSPSRIAPFASLGLLLAPRPGLLAQPPVHPQPVVVPAPVMFSQPNPYDVWQVYAVDRQGFWRPRVVLTPAGPYRILDGAYSPYMAVRPRDVDPTVSDSLGPVPLQPAPLPPAPARRRGWLR
jgi:hypothetical protein